MVFSPGQLPGASRSHEAGAWQCCSGHGDYYYSSAVEPPAHASISPVIAFASQAIIIIINFKRLSLDYLYQTEPDEVYLPVKQPKSESCGLDMQPTHR